MIVAVDGPAGSGKGTVTKKIEEELGFLNLDTGATYRCVALEALRKGFNLKDEKKIIEIANNIDIKIDNTGEKDIILLNGEDVSKKIRTKEVTSIVSQISSIIPVRKKMVEIQRNLAKGKNVIVIGGGDTGNDCVGTSIRHGAKSVLQLEMMPKAPDERTPMNPWPEWPRVCKTDYGQQEAIAVFGSDPRVYTTTVKEFVKDKKGNLCKAVLIKLESKTDGKTGRKMMVPVEGSEYTVNADLVLIAAGFLGSQDYVTKAFGVEVNERTNVKTEAGKYSTNVKDVFTAGDMHRGQSLVVWAIREGRDAAADVDEYLMGYAGLK